MFRLVDQIGKQQLDEFCKRHHIRKLSLFGSALRDRMKPQSDVDILVDFEENQTPGLMDMAGMEIELTEMLGTRVDLRTPDELSRYFRDDVLTKARVEYAS